MSGSSNYTYKNGNNMSAEDAHRLNEAQSAFEHDSTNAQRAYEYFQELNKHQFYVSVVREYEAFNDRKLVTERHYGQWATRMTSQYDYALDHLKQMVTASDLGDNGSTYDSYRFGVDMFYGGIVLAAYVAAYYYFEPFKNSGGLGGPQDNYKFEIKKANEVEQRLDDVKGIDEIKGEIQDLIKMIKNSSDYTSKGAKLYKGVLLSGSPGTGKTLLARAIAGESGVNFIYCTGSNFDEMFVGLGAKRVRELFAKARESTPCIIFIDEIDSLMSKSRRFGSEHSSSRGTINQLLAEMDGFEKTDQILVIGATNHVEDLDPAAVRPGRFDKKIDVPRPDVNGRKDILELYLAKIHKDDNIEAGKLAKMTPGFTGAEIQNLVNTAITQAVHMNKEKADLSDFEYARDRLMMGIERKKLAMSEINRLNTAIHEAGHATVCYYTEGGNKLYKATVVARGGSLGATYMEPDDSAQVSMTKIAVLANIDTAMGGHVAEKLFIGKDKITTGCSSDLQNATQMAYQAVSRFGMFGEEVGYTSTDERQLSEDRKGRVDEAVKKILEESEKRVEKMLLEKD